jgi:hypothetical protein
LHPDTHAVPCICSCNSPAKRCCTSWHTSIVECPLFCSQRRQFQDIVHLCLDHEDNGVVRQERIGTDQYKEVREPWHCHSEESPGLSRQRSCSSARFRPMDQSVAVVLDFVNSLRASWGLPRENRIARLNKASREPNRPTRGTPLHAPHSDRDGLVARGRTKRSACSCEASNLDARQIRGGVFLLVRVSRRVVRTRRAKANG